MYFYEDEDDEDDRAPLPTGIKRNDYQDYFLRMKEMGTDKKWTDAQLGDSLKNRAAGEKQYEAVSK
jgi:hypothetical protein